MNDKEKIKLEIEKGYYNKTYSKDGINYIVADKDYPYYMVHLYKRYKDIDNKEELKRELKKDLKELVVALDEEKERDDE